jgi:hypothetical protein
MRRALCAAAQLLLGLLATGPCRQPISLYGRAAVPVPASGDLACAVFVFSPGCSVRRSTAPDRAATAEFLAGPGGYRILNLHYHNGGFGSWRHDAWG